MSNTGTRRAALGATAFAVLVAVAFLVVRPPVGDLWAARARVSAIESGVGLHYWFSWFAGVVPGHYSVLVPLLAHVLDLEVLGAVATVAITPLAWVLVRPARHPVAATWVATVAAGLNLWSGRVPFALGGALALATLWALIARRAVATLASAVVTALVSPVAAVFLALGLVGVLVHQPERRRLATATVGAAVAVLVAVGAYFGTPGPEGFTVVQAVGSGLACVVLLLTRPSPAVRTVAVVSLVVCVAVAVIPNGLGSNFERFTWLCLPVAAVATARVRLRRAVVAAFVAVGCSAIGSAKDLWVAAQPQSDASYYAGVIARLDRIPELADYRLEVVPDGTHVAAAVLPEHAALARGYETQTDGALNAVLLARRLDAATYRRWLDRFAVGYVLLTRHSLFRTPEDDLVRRHTPRFLTVAWSDAHFVVYAVRHPTPVVDAPAHVVDADQSNLEIHAPRPCTVLLRVHWSGFLRAEDGSRPAVLRPAPGAFVRMTMPAAGVYTVHA